MFTRCWGRSVFDGRMWRSAEASRRGRVSWGATTLAWNQRTVSLNPLGRGKRGPHVLARLEHLAVNDGKTRDVLVPFQQRRAPAAQSMSKLVELPHGIDHRTDVRVEDVRPEVRVARYMIVGDPLRRNRADVGLGVEMMIEG